MGIRIGFFAAYSHNLTIFLSFGAPSYINKSINASRKSQMKTNMGRNSDNLSCYSQTHNLRLRTYQERDAKKQRLQQFSNEVRRDTYRGFGEDLTQQLLVTLNWLSGSGPESRTTNAHTLACRKNIPRDKPHYLCKTLTKRRRWC